MKQIKKVLSALLISMLLFSISILNVYADDLSGVTIKNFRDVKESDWYYATLGEIVSRGVISGYPDNTFRPLNNITRAEFTKILLNSLNISINQSSEIFLDTSGHWAKDIIYTAWTKEIIRKADFGAEEYDNNVSYYPDKEITRIEMSRMAVRALGLAEDAKVKEGTKTEFEDDSAIKDADKGYVILASNYGIVKGYTDETFKPNGLATRAEAAQMLLNMLNVEFKDKEETDVVKRVNEKLQTRDVEIKLLDGIKSVAVHEMPKTIEELKENLESLKEYDYTGKKGTWEMLDISQVVSNNDYDEFVEDFVGVVKMSLPNSELRLSTDEINGIEYNVIYNDTLIKDGFGTGRLIENGEITERVNLSNSYYGVGKKDEGKIYIADYIGFVKKANNFISSQDGYDRVLVIFENPFKK